MKIARLAILGISLAAGLLVARMVMNTGPEPVAEPVAVVSETPKDEVLVADRDIALGSSVSSGDLRWTEWPKELAPQSAILRSERPGALDELVGRIAKAPVYEGEPLREERLINSDRGFMSSILPKGKRAIAVSVEALTAAGGFILPGDKVDVILTRQSGNRGSNSFLSETILQNVRVLAIDTTTAGEQNEKSLPPGQTATLELLPSQAEVVAQASQLGTISLVLRSAEDSADNAETEEVGGGVNFVKFGVSGQMQTQK
ncbi:Flp pilus assembly protein CpaB [Stappia sp.]|jgi:pilus assembly protein CpaB|uniref:Flp pilus assembly protein CpaB n=1 Tax=Stappia sp. TaxID=1870903 RepID=UPI003A9A5B49